MNSRIEHHGNSSVASARVVFGDATPGDVGVLLAVGGEALGAAGGRGGGRGLGEGTQVVPGAGDHQMWKVGSLLDVGE